MKRINMAMPIQDKAIELSLKYLSIIETRLGITWNEQDQPVCIIDWISSENIQDLRDDLDLLLGGTLSLEARKTSSEYGNGHIQTVGFGHASNFDQFVKLGFLYGERVVLWDVISSRLLVGPHPSKNILAQTVCKLLALRPVIERGGLVILPHPIRWSPIAEKIDAELRAQGNKCAVTLGISMALAAVDSGIPLHPYTLLRPGPQPTAHDEVSSQERNLYSPENYIFHNAIISLLRDQRLAYLQEVNVERFYQVVSKHTDLQHALRKHFISDLKGLSPQQTQVTLGHLSDDLIRLLEKRNKDLITYVADGAEATAPFVISALTAVGLGVAALDALTTSGFSVALIAAMRKWRSTPEKNVIVQAFQQLYEQDTLPNVSRDDLVEDTDTKNLIIYEDIKKIYEKFMSYSWTEERHYFLKELSSEVSIKLLRSLKSEDVWKIVNHRTFQEAYIGEYLDYLWELDEELFWEHVGITFESTEGMIVSDDGNDFEVMCSNEMPNNIWIKLLNLLLIGYKKEIGNHCYGHYELECLREIIRFQTEKTIGYIEKRVALREWFSFIPEDGNKESVLWFFNYVYSNGLPQWFLETIHPESPHIEKDDY